MPFTTNPTKESRVVITQARVGAPTKHNWPDMIAILSDLPVNGRPIPMRELRPMLGNPTVSVAHEVIRRARLALAPEVELAYDKKDGVWGYFLTDDKKNLRRYRNRNVNRAVADMEAVSRTSATLVRQYRGSGSAQAKQERGLAVLFEGLLCTIKNAQEALESDDLGL